MTGDLIFHYGDLYPQVGFGSTINDSVPEIEDQAALSGEENKTDVQKVGKGKQYNIIMAVIVLIVLIAIFGFSSM